MPILSRTKYIIKQKKLQAIKILKTYVHNKSLSNDKKETLWVVSI